MRAVPPAPLAYVYGFLYPARKKRFYQPLKTRSTSSATPHEKQ